MTQTKIRRAALAALGGAVLTLTAACSTVSTGASEVALEYGGGSFDSANFVKCFGNGYKSTTEGASDIYRYYPTGQRDFTFSNDKSADSAPLSSMTEDSQLIQVVGTIKFTMNLSCKSFKDPTGKTWPGGTAQYFHELFGSKDFPDGSHAYNDQGSQPYGRGWSAMLRQYLGFAADTEVDDNALAYTLGELNVSDRKTAWQRNIQRGLPDVLRQMTGGVDIFRITAVILARPGISPKIADANTEAEAARIRAEGNARATEIDKQTAQNFPGGMAAYQQYLNQQANNEALKEAARQGKVMPVPYGSPVIVPGN